MAPTELAPLFDPRERLSLSFSPRRATRQAESSAISICMKTLGFDLWDEQHVQDHRNVSSERVTDAALGMLASLTEQQHLWFLFVHYFDPHYAYIDHEVYDHAPAPTAFVAGEESMLWLKQKVPRMTARDLSVLIGRYDEEIRLADAQIGRLLARLGELGPADGTITVFTSGHGEEFGERGAIGHSTLYDEVIRAPLLVHASGPGVQARRIPDPVSLGSIAPTWLDLAGVPFDPARFDAASLGSLAYGEASPTDCTPIFSDSFNKHAVREGRFKLMRDATTGDAALYNLDQDPHETVNLFPKKPRVAGRLTKLLGDRRKAPTIQAPTFESDAAMREQLRELGYTDD